LRAVPRGRNRRHVERLVDAGLDVEVEVDADPLEEGVVQGDESDLDRDLEVLEPPQLFEQVGDLLVYLLRLADDEREVRFELTNRAVAAAVGPGPGPADGVLDEVDE
jgi:hypothetical protein